MSEHQPPPDEPGRPQPDDADPDHGHPGHAGPGPAHAAGTSEDAAEAELIRKVIRTQERHREGGVDPELDQDAAGLGLAGGADGGEHSGG